ncbi:MAG TPA: PmoA family protein [Chthonomonadaceae bacterium]|nr:PmoA family protein [Chthonomonadaceae bacterium]
MPEPEFRLIVHAGPHDRSHCPVRVTLSEPLPEGEWELAADSSQTRPLQRLEGNEVVFLETALRAGESRTYRVRPHQTPDKTSLPVVTKVAAVTLTHAEGERIEIQTNGSLLTRYIYGNVPARPYFFPLIGPQGIRITRSYPMEDVPGEMQDHPHHRSLWIAFGEVNGADNWSEEPGHGYTLHQSVDRLEDGEVAGRFATTSLWARADKTPLLTQRLAVTVWGTDASVRLLDFDIRLEATHGDVHFGDTKEGGILSTRVASAMDVPRGGRIENVYGGVNEGETWGKAAHWCDYSGVVEGQQVGIAILDHPLSFRYPTHWHVRDYGLMTANPFGYAAFTNGVKDGSYTLQAGDALEFHYRLVLHRGNASEGRVNAHYLNFVAPPRVEVTP